VSTSKGVEGKAVNHSDILTAIARWLARSNATGSLAPFPTNAVGEFVNHHRIVFLHRLLQHP